LKKKILVTASSYPSSDIDNTGIFIKEFCQNLSSNYDIILLTHHLKGQKKHEFHDGVEIVRFPFLPFGLFHSSFKYGVFAAFSKNLFLFVVFAPLYILMQIVYICRIVSNNKIELVHAHWLIPQGFCAVVSSKFIKQNFKVLTTIHGADIFAFNNRISVALKKYVLKHVDAISVVSNHIKNEVDPLSNKRDIHVLPMGVFTTEFGKHLDNNTLKAKYVLNDNPLLLFVGRLTEKKGVIYLLKAMPKLIDSYPGIMLLIVGDGVQFDELNEYVFANSLENNIIFLGSIKHDQLPAYYSAADIFIGPSIVAADGDSEGLGLVFVEAASSETLVISTDFPAIQDVIQHKKTGYTIEQKSEQAISDAILYALSHTEESAKLASQGRQHVVEKFDWTNVTQRYTELYESLLIHT